MANRTEKTGSCLCGNVKFTAKQVSQHVGACHCNMCRTWGGGPLMAVDSGTDVEFNNSDYISVYDSSDWAERGFCSRCGSHLFYRIKATHQYMIPAGLFDENENFEFSSQVFIDNKPDFYEFKNDTKNLTEAEIFAMYAKPDD